MAQIKIRSNPYKKVIEYSLFDEKAGKYVEINYENNPTSKLIGDEFRVAFLINKSSDILKAIYDSWYDKNDKIRIIFEGTDVEFNRILDDAKVYNSSIIIQKGDEMLQDENTVLNTLIDVARRIGINANADGDIYSKIYELRNMIIDNYNTVEKELSDTKDEFDKLMADKNSDNELLIDTIKKQNEMRIIDIVSEKDDLKTIKAKYVKEYVIDKKTLENEYDKLKELALKEVKDKEALKKEEKNDENENNAAVNEECQEENVDKSVEENKNQETKENKFGKMAKEVLDKGKDLAKVVIDSDLRVKTTKAIGKFVKNTATKIKEDVDANMIADRRFMDYVNTLYNNSFRTFTIELKKNICDIMKEKSNNLKEDVINSVSQNANENEKVTIKSAIDDLVLFDESKFVFIDDEEKKFKSIDVVVHLPGVPNVNGIRNEWSNEIRKYIDITYTKFYDKKIAILNEWEERIIKELKESIVNMNPKIKEQLEIIEKVNEMMNDISTKFEAAKNAMSVLESIISYESIE